MSQIDELRQIIIGDSSEQLAELKRRIEDIDQRTKDVAEVLSPAIDSEIERGGQRLVSALQRPVSIGLKQAIRAEPKEYAEILYPVMAPSIRRAIARAISSMLVTINRTLESATSVRGISLRIQSLRTGIPYGELALRRSLLFHVAHLYLIHRDTGMLIEQVTSKDATSLDADAVGAMFSAIQSFVQDSFSRDETARLTDLKVGDHNVWVAHGPQMMLACVIVGDAPESLKSELYDVLYTIRTDYASAIADFDGDLADFAGVDHLLAPLLRLQLRDDTDDKPQGFIRTHIPLVLLFALALFAGIHWFVSASKIRTVEHFLRQSPGIATTSVYWDDDQIVVEGLQDPDAKIPYAILESYGISEDKLRFDMIPFRSLETDMELQRFRQELELPRGVYLSAKSGRVSLYGEAPIRWLLTNDTRIRQLAADRRLNIARLSASYESVSDLLRSYLVESADIDLSMRSLSGDDVTTVEINGMLKADQIALLNAIFAGSHWVRINANVSHAATSVQPK